MPYNIKDHEFSTPQSYDEYSKQRLEQKEKERKEKEQEKKQKEKEQEMANYNALVQAAQNSARAKPTVSAYQPKKPASAPANVTFKPVMVDNIPAPKENLPKTNNNATGGTDVKPGSSAGDGKGDGSETGTNNKTDTGNGTSDAVVDLLQMFYSMTGGNDSGGQGSGWVSDFNKTYKNNNTQAMKQSQTLSDNIYSHLNNLTSLYQDLYTDQKTFNPLDADWAKEIMSYYGVQSGAAANNARASGAADNAGNIDSYAAANAERQRLSTLNAGMNSIFGMSQNRFNNMLSTLQSIGVDTTNLFGVEQQNVQSALSHAGDTGSLAVSANEAQLAADAQYNQTLSNLMASLMGAGTVDGSTDQEETIPSYPDYDAIEFAVRVLVESGDYDLSDEEGITKELVKNYPEFLNHENAIRTAIRWMQGPQPPQGTK